MGFFAHVDEALGLSKGVTSVSNALADLNHDVNRELSNFDSSLGLSTTVTALVNNPLPTLAAFAITATTGIPPSVSMAIVNVANGKGSMEDILKSAAMSYISGQVGTAAGKAFAGSDFATNTLSPEMAKTLTSIVTSASGDAAVTALQGRPLNEILASGMNSAVTSYVTQGLTKQLGLTDAKSIPQAVTRDAISAATSAILSGKDVGKAITQSVVQTALSQGIKTGVDSIVKNSETIKGLVTSFNDAKKSAEDYFTKTLNPQYSIVTAAQATANESRAALQNLAKDYKDKYDAYVGAKAYAESYVQPVVHQDGYYTTVDYGGKRGTLEVWNPATDTPTGKTKDQVIAEVNAMIPGVNAAASVLETTAKKAATDTDTYNKAVEAYNPLVSAYEGLAKLAKDAFTTLETKNTEQNTLIDKVAKDTTAYEAETEKQAGVVANALGADALAQAKKVAIDDPIAAAYREALGRDASASEISSWSQQVASKGIDSVISSINNSQEAVTRKETTQAKEAYSSITGSEPTAAEIADFRKSGNVVEAAQDAAINGLDLPADYKFPDQANKVSFATAYANARKNLGPNATFEWTNPETGKVGKFSTQTEAEAIKPFDATSMSRSGLGAGAKAALDAGKTTFTWADGKVYKVPDAYAFMLGSSQSNAETQRLLAAGVVPAKSTDKANDYFGNEFVTDPMTGAVVSGNGWASGTSGKTFDAINTAAGGALVKALDVGSGMVKGGSNIVGQVGTLAGLTGLVDMDNLAVRTSNQINDAVDQMRSKDFKDNQELMYKAIAKAGNAGVFEQAVETAKQFGVNPTQLAEFVVQNGMSLLVGSGAMTVARGLGAGMTVAEAASLGANALTQGASVAQDTYNQAIKDGVSPEDALTRARAAGAVGGVVSAVANKFIPGALSNETRLAEAAIVKESLVKALKGEIPAEIVEEVSGRISQNVANGKAWNEDLGTTAVQAMLGSGLVTSLVHVSTGNADPIASTPETGLEGVTPQQFKATTELLSKNGQVPTAAQVTDAVKTTQEEATQFYQEAFGAPPTPAQLQAFVGKPEAEVQQVISVDQTALSKEHETAYRVEAAKQTDLAEAARLAGDAAGQAAAESAAKTAKAKADQIKALVTAHPELAAAKTPSEITADNILAITSGATTTDLRYDLNKDGKVDAKDAVLGSSGTAVRTDIRADGTPAFATVKEVQDAIAGIQFPAGITSNDVTQAITNYMSKNPGITLQQVASAITAGTTGLATDAGVKTSISNALKGVATTADVNAAIANIKFPAGLTKADVAAEIKTAMAANPGLSAADVTKSITDYMTKNPALTKADVTSVVNTEVNKLNTSIATLKSDLSNEIDAAIASGLSGDAALQKGLDTLSAKVGTNQAALLSKIGATESTLKSDFATKISGLETKLTAAIAAAQASGLQGDAALKTAIDSVAATQKTDSASLLKQIGTTEANLSKQFATQLTGLDVKLTAAIAEAKASGLAGDKALQAAINTVAATQKTDSASLLKSIGTTEANLKTLFTGQLSSLEDKLSNEIDAAVASGLSGDAALQKGLDTLSAKVGTNQTALLAQIGKSADTLKTQFTNQITSLDTKLSAEIDAAIASGLKGDAALQKGLDTLSAKMGTNQTDLLTQLGKTATDLKTQFSTQISGVQANLAQAQKDILAEVAKNEAAGMTRDTALQKAITTVAATQKTDVATLTKSISGLGTTLGNEITALQTDLAQTEKDILAQVAVNEKAGMTRDAALQSAINTVAATQKTDTASLLTKLGTTEAALKTQIATQVTSLDTKLSAAIADAKAAGLKGDAALQSAIDKVAADQKTTAADILTQMGKTTADLKTQFASDISGLSKEMQTKYDALSQAQKDAVDAQVQQGKDLTLAITESAAGLQSQITGLGTDVQAKYDALTAAQKLEVDARVKQGVDLTSAINAAQVQTQVQIGSLSTDLQTKYDALTKADQAIVDAQIKQGIDTKTAIDNATKTTTQQINTVKTDLTKNITDVQTQFNTRVDELVKQGKSYQDATQAALGELNTGVLGLQTSVTDIKAAQAAEAAKAAAEKTAAAKAAKDKAAQQNMMSGLTAGANYIRSKVAPAAEEAARPWAQLGLTSTGGEAKFEGALDAFLKDAEAGFYEQKQPNEPQQQAAPAKKELDMEEKQGANYFSYGNESDINSVLSENPGTQMLYSKAGGLATPMFAKGGKPHMQNYAGGGLNVIQHEGKPRIDFRSGNAVTGPGDGQSDDIPAMLADGEFVFPADVVAALGNGSTKAGSDKLYDMMHSIRAYHRSAKPKDLPPPAKKSPLDYLKKTA